MAVGKIAKLLVKLGKKDLVREFSKAPVKTALKKAGQALIWPSSKLHDIQTPYRNANTIGRKAANCILKPLNWAGAAMSIGSVAGILGGLGVAIYSNNTGDKELEEKAFVGVSKSADAFIGAVGGFVLGGPLGALVLGGLALNSDKSWVTLLASTTENEETVKYMEKQIGDTKKELLNDAKGLINKGLEAVGINTDNTDTATETSTDASQQEVQKEEENPEIENDKAAVEDFCKGLENLEVGQTITVPEIKAEGNGLKMQAGDQEVELKPGDKITRTKDGFEITRANNQESENVKKETPEAVVKEEKKEEDDGDKPKSAAPATNLFGGTINGITKKTHTIVDGDCLWNIAKKELQDANPGKTITNAQIVKQVKEFGKLNPQIFGENPSYKDLDLIHPKKELKLCA